MTRIFLRIYGGISLSLLLVALFTFLAFQGVNHFRLMDHRIQTVSGSLNFIAASLERKQKEERVQYLEKISESLGAPVEIRELDQLSLRKKELNKIKKGELIFISSQSKDAYAIAVKIPKEQNLLVSIELTNVTEQMGRATVVLIADYLNESQSKTEQLQKMEIMKPSFGFPISVVAPIQVFLDSEQWDRIGRDESVLALDETIKAVRLYKSLSNTGQVLFLGPIEQFNPFPFQLILLIGFLGLSFLGVAAYALVRPLEWRLRGLEKMVKRIKKGHLDARVEVVGRDGITQLTLAFNQMAEHVQIMLDSQKELTSAVSHELRTPVARLRFGLEMIEDANTDEDRLKFLQGMDVDIEQLDTLIDEILTYARLEQGTPVLNFKKLNVNDILIQICQEMTKTAEKAGVALEFGVQSSGNTLVEAEARYIHRVAQNLVGNSIRYAESRVRLKFDIQGDFCKIIVEDDGPGIPEVEWEHVFTPFARLDTSRNRASGGYGLGLSIVQRIAFWHGGKVVVRRSNLGGALFEMEWPIKQKRSSGAIGAVVNTLKQIA